jgi:formate dehydrogenase subunit gamma
MNKKNLPNRHPRKIRRYIRRREAMEAAHRFRVADDGTRYIIRFTPAQTLQHWLLLFSFTTLGITGLAQTFENTSVGYAVLYALGGIESARQIHHIAAFIFGVTSIYHFAISIYETFVYRKISRIWPDWSDFTNLIEMLKLNLGLSHKHPQFDRFSFEEKAEYWALIWGTIVMGATGLMQWFPLQVTSVLPGWMIPVGNALHRWEAILAVLAILTWHMYHTLIKTRNFSIFSGVMTVDQMKEEHPVELAYLEHAVMALDNSRSWPALIEFEIEEPEEETTPAPKEIKKAPEKETVTEVPAQVETMAINEASPNAASDASVNEAESADKKEDEEPAPSAAPEASLTESFSSGEA